MSYFNTKIDGMTALQRANGNIGKSLFGKLQNAGVIKDAAPQLGFLGSLSNASGVIGSAISTLSSGASMIDSFNADSPNGYTPEGEIQQDKNKAANTASTAFSVANLVLSVLATVGTSGAAVPYMVGSIASMIGAGASQFLKK